MDVGYRPGGGLDQLRRGRLLEEKEVEGLDRDLIAGVSQLFLDIPDGGVIAGTVRNARPPVDGGEARQGLLVSADRLERDGIPQRGAVGLSREWRREENSQKDPG